MNDFGQTDHITDLFEQINTAYSGGGSIFDDITADDLVLAFFPCTRFEAKIPLGFRGEMHQMKQWDNIKRLEYAINLHNELHNLYVLICKLFIIAYRKGFPMIVENPYTQPHYLTTYFPVKPSVIDNNRMENGDYYKKPTQFWFLNLTPMANIVFEPLELTPIVTVDNAHKFKVAGGRKVARSMIHPQYARRFIKGYILDRE